MWAFINVRSPNEVTKITHQYFKKGKCDSKTGVSAKKKYSVKVFFLLIIHINIMFNNVVLFPKNAT